LRPSSTRSKKLPIPLYRRLLWGNIFVVLFLITIAVGLIYVTFFLNFNTPEASGYKIQYVEYTIQPDDSISRIVQSLNTEYPKGWDSRDYVDLTLKRNHITDPQSIPAYKVIEVPVSVKQ